MSEPKTGAVHRFLMHPAVQAISSALICGTVGFAMSLLIGSFLLGGALPLLLTGLSGAFLLAAFGTWSSLTHKRNERLGPNMLAWVASFGGCTMLIAAALSLLGVAGPLLLFAAIGAGLLVASLLAIVR